MKTLPCRWPTVALLALILSAGAIHFHPQLAAAEETCGEFGTSVQFVESPAEAGRLALKAEKLVFVLHVSGYFEEPDFT